MNLNSLFDKLHFLKQTVSCYHAEGASELISDNIKDLLIPQGCRLTSAPPYTPQLNGQAERNNQTVQQMTYTLLLNCDIPLDMQPYAVKQAVLLCIMLPIKSNKDSKSPIEVKIGTVSNLAMCKIFACRAKLKLCNETM